ncbi:MAG: WXG100 family type VII secretion target, partial [Pseudonocardiaceae bacterium]
HTRATDYDRISATRVGGHMSFYGDPDELDHLAGQIERRAEEVRDHASGMDARARAMRWKSVAADRARETVTGDRRNLDETAQRLDEAAALLRRHAQNVRETIAEIKQIEQAVTAWFSKAIVEFNNAVAEFTNLVNDVARGVVHWITGEQPEPPREPWQGWPHQPHNLPASGDKQWLQVGEFMRKQGVSH